MKNLISLTITLLISGCSNLSNPAKLKNDDGFLITPLPYSSNPHLN